MPGSLRRLLHALTALGLLTATGAGLLFLSLRAGRTEPALVVGFAPGPPPGTVTVEAAADPGTDAFTAPIAVALEVDLALLPLPPADPAVLTSPHHPYSAADLAAAGPFGLEMVRRRDQGQRLTVSLIEALAGQILGSQAVLGDLADADGDGRDDDGRFTLAAADGSAACLTLGPPRLLALALGLHTDPADGLPASGYSWDPSGPCPSGPSPPAGAGAPDGSTPGVYGASGAGEVCDVALLLDYLEASPPVAEAWALVRDLEVTTLAEYAAGLTPVVLLTDTLVTDHGYDSGKVLPRRAVLQRGTTVLVDPLGRPVARCLSGSPLLPARALADDPEVLGTAWAGFDPGRVAEVVPAEREVAEFLLLDLATGRLLRRVPGVEGAAAGLAGPVVAVAG